MRVITKVLDEGVFQKLKSSLLEEDVAWYTSLDVDYETASEDIRQHSFYIPLAYGDKDLGVLPEVRSIILNMMDSIGEPVEELIRIRVGMHVWVGENVLNPPHVDNREPHKVGLLYITEADSPTVLYSNKYDYNSPIPPVDYIKGHTLEVLDNILPEENKLLLFEGSYYHASTTPSKVAKRITINFNYRSK